VVDVGLAGAEPGGGSAVSSDDVVVDGLVVGLVGLVGLVVVGLVVADGLASLLSLPQAAATRLSPATTIAEATIRRRGRAEVEVWCMVLFLHERSVLTGTVSTTRLATRLPVADVP
jgi:hypothetical protein